MNKIFKDIYFFDAQEALGVAKEQNRVDLGHSSITGLQICYYDGAPLQEKDIPKNCIHLPLKKFKKYFKNNATRLPSDVSFENTNYNLQKQQNILETIKQYQKDIVKDILEYNDKLIKKLKKQKPNFKDKRLKVFLPACRTTTVMQYISKHIEESFRKFGFDTMYIIQNELEDCDILSLKFLLKRVYKFNPHIVVNINHINSNFLNKKVFNFIWFQDQMPVLLNNSKISLRKRDFVFSLVSELDSLLQKKHIPYKRQSFCINNKIFKRLKNIKREKKIVFIGSSYYNQIKNYNIQQEIIDFLESMFLQGISFTPKVIDMISSKLALDKVFVSMRLIPYIIRDMSVRMLCSIDTSYKIEVYGWGWDRYKEVVPYYQGALSYGEDIAKVYNSSTYVFSPHQLYTIQQRVLEGVACGAIPIVYDIREIIKEDDYPEVFEYFKTKEDLEIILQNKPKKKQFNKILEDHSYDKFVKKMIKRVKKGSKK